MSRWYCSEHTTSGEMYAILVDIADATFSHVAVNSSSFFIDSFQYIQVDDCVLVELF